METGSTTKVEGMQEEDQDTPKESKQRGTQGEGKGRGDREMELWEVTMNEYREERRMLRVGPEELERETKRVRAEEVKEVMKAHRDTMKKAVYAGSTPDIDVSDVATTDMMNTTVVTSNKI